MTSVAQTTNTTGISVQQEVPRVISRPQAADQLEANQAPGVTTAGGSADSTGNALPDWIPAPIRHSIGNSLSQEQQALVASYGLPVVAALAAVVLMLIGFLLGRRRNRPTYQSEQDDTGLYNSTYDELDFGELDMAAATAAFSSDKAAEKTPEKAPEKAHDSTVMLDEFDATTSVEPLDDFAPPAAGNNAHRTPARDTSPTMRTPQTEPLSSRNGIATDDAGDTGIRDRNAYEAPQPIAEQAAMRSPADTYDDDGVSDNDQTVQITPQSEITDSAYDDTIATDTSALMADQGDNRAEAASRVESNTPKIRVMTKFGVWLNELPAEEGRRASMEAFLYWVSYGAGKFSPDLRQKLDEAVELDQHGRIKRAVLSFRAEVLHDILLSLKTHLDPSMRLPFLDLMLAVLVTGKGIQPVENLLIRYYCDFLDINPELLKSRYQQAFASELPAIPRPDKDKWWTLQPTSLPVEAMTEVERDLALFGLDNSAKERDISQAYSLAKLRHAAERFELLGEQEQSLAARNMHKYRHAFEALTEIEA